METFEITKNLSTYTSCRACLQHIDEYGTYYRIFAVPDLQNKFTNCTSLPADPEDGYPSNICEQCHNKIIDFYNFKQLCIFAKEQFEEFLSLDVKLTISELEVTPLDENIKVETVDEDDWYTGVLESNGNFNECTESTDDIKCVEKVDYMIPLMNIEIKESEANADEGGTVANGDDSESIEHPGLQEDLNEFAEHTNIEIKIQEDPCSENENEYSSEDEEFSDYEQLNLKHPSNNELDSISKKKDPSKKVRSKKFGDGEYKIKFTCELCGKKFFKLECFEAHQRVHQGLKPYPCSHCDRYFSKLCFLKQHERSRHDPNPEKFPCAVTDCDKVYNSKRSLQEHVKQFHFKMYTPKPKFVCEKCGKVLTGLTSLKNHRFYHTGKPRPHACTECQKGFMTAFELRQHMNRHAGIKRFVCPECGARRISRVELNIHLRVHSSDKKYPCNICKEVFNNFKKLTEHKRSTHPELYKYPCSYCDLSFFKPLTRNRHEKTHFDEKNLECNICQKKFNHDGALDAHKRVVHFKKTKRTYNVVD